MNEDQLNNLAIALMDQAWQGVVDYADDIKRIADEGLNGTQTDENVVKMVLHAVYGKICFDKADAIDLEAQS